MSGSQIPHNRMLCGQCNIALIYGLGFEGIHHGDLASFTNAARKGCYICKHLLQDIRRRFNPLEKSLIDTRFRYRFRLPAIDLIFSVHKNGKLTLKEWTLHLLSTSHCIVDLKVRLRESCLPLPDAFGSAKRWIRDCLFGHDQCLTSTQPPSYPARVLELRRSSLRLIHPTEETIYGPYAALSHCWGINHDFLQLTTSNLGELQAGISYNALPLAFQEATELIKALDITYLWIDSLCILQSGPGSLEDWHSESVKMQHVYKNCVLNLSLSRASNPNESCFGGCSPDVVPPFEVKSSLHVDDESSMITWGSTEASAVAISNYVALPGLYYSEALYNQPLAHRAWALQERLLAPRVLSCGLGELFWECDQLPDASESFPEGLGGNASGNLLFSRDSIIPNSTDIDVLSRFWLQTLSDYVRCDLTYPETDKLVALAAVSNQMEIMMDDVCLAGHFWKTLIPSLNWFISDETRSPTRRRQGSTKGIKSQRQVIMPTWSWASMDGPLLWHLPPVKPVSLAESEAYELPHHNRINLATQENPIRLIIRAYCGALDDVLLLEIEESLHLEIAMDDSNKIVSGKSPYSIAALVYIPKMSDGWQGLILEAVEKDEEVIYKRVGHYALYNPYSSEDQKWKYDSRAWVEKMKMLHGQERKTITLI